MGARGCAHGMPDMSAWAILISQLGTGSNTGHKLCNLASCRRYFLPIGSQRYCTPQCKCEHTDSQKRRK